MQPVLIGGLFIGVLSALPIVQLCNCCCVWIAGGGALSAYLQQQQGEGPSLTVMSGARVGLLAGLVGAVVWLIVTQALDVVLAPLQERFLAEILRNARDMPPEVRTWLESVEAGRSGGYFFGFFLMLSFGSLAAALGGAAGAAYFRKDVPPALGGPANPPPLP
jgi:hypothetical protein